MLNDSLARAATAATIIIMFFAIIWLQPLIETLQTSLQVTSGVAAVVVSRGVYGIIADMLFWVFRKSLFLRRMFLGRAFIEGTWVGHYIHDGQHRFTIEYIDQASGATVIRGREFDADGNTKALWSSDTVSIDTDRMKLVYAYNCNVFERNYVHEGLGIFAMVPEDTGKPPTKLDGYSVDLIDGDRDPNTEYKINVKPVADEVALAKAREIFQLSGCVTSSSSANVAA